MFETLLAVVFVVTTIMLIGCACARVDSMAPWLIAGAIYMVVMLYKQDMWWQPPAIMAVVAVTYLALTATFGYRPRKQKRRLVLDDLFIEDDEVAAERLLY